MLLETLTAGSQLSGALGGSGMFGGGMESSSSTSDGQFYSGPFSIGDDSMFKYVPIVLFVLIVFLLLKGKK